MFQKFLVIIAGIVSSTVVTTAGTEAAFAGDPAKDIAAISTAIALEEHSSQPVEPVEAAVAKRSPPKFQEDASWMVAPSTPVLQVYKLEAEVHSAASARAQPQDSTFVSIHELSENELTPSNELLPFAFHTPIAADLTLQATTLAVHSLQPTVSPVATTGQREFEIPAGYIQLSNGVYVSATWAAHTVMPARARATHIRGTGAGLGAMPGATHLIANQLMSRESNATSVASVGAVPSFAAPSSAFPIYPLPRITTLTSLYGMRGDRLHQGVDFAVPVGTPVLAALSGRVTEVQWLDGYGLTVILEHTSGTTSTLYAHLSRSLVSRGMQVQQGQAIALSGNTGRSTGPHLHFEIQERVAGEWRAINLNNIVRHSQRLKEQGTQIAQTSAATTAIDPAAIMRVAVVVDASAVAIAGSHGLILRSVRGELLGTLPQMRNFSVSALSGALIVGDRSANQNLSQTFFVEPAQPGGLVAVNGRWYRGRVLVGMRPGGLIAVNWVGMEDYLRSVVGSEMIPSWPLHALKAQAIAARSYALAHRLRPANRHWFDLLSTPRHQAYRGVEAETRSTNQAVALTRGMILASTPAFMQQYQRHAVNGVVEALYASTQDIVDEVHNGFGLSQWGAASLAQRGESYLRILGFYYPETAIVRIY